MTFFSRYDTGGLILSEGTTWNWKSLTLVFQVTHQMLTKKAVSKLWCSTAVPHPQRRYGKSSRSQWNAGENRGAADQTRRLEFVTGAYQLEQLNAHNGNNPQIVEDSPTQFKSPGSQQAREDLIEVTIEDCDANLNHILLAHSDPVDVPKGTYARGVVAA